MTFLRWLDSILGARPDFGENVRGGGKIFRGGATMISPSRQSKNKIPYFHNFYRIMSAFYTFLSSLYDCLLKFISLIILLGKVQKFLGEVLKISGEVQSHPRGFHTSPQNLALFRRIVYIQQRKCIKFEQNLSLNFFCKKIFRF